MSFFYFASSIIFVPSAAGSELNCASSFTYFLSILTDVTGHYTVFASPRENQLDATSGDPSAQLLINKSQVSVKKRQ